MPRSGRCAVVCAQTSSECAGVAAARIAPPRHRPIPGIYFRFFGCFAPWIFRCSPGGWAPRGSRRRIGPACRIVPPDRSPAEWSPSWLFRSRACSAGLRVRLECEKPIKWIMGGLAAKEKAKNGYFLSFSVGWHRSCTAWSSWMLTWV